MHDDLKRPSCNGEPHTMRVIAPIDGWLYSGQLSYDEGSGASPQYVVKLDGDATGGSYLFGADTVLNDVIKEVRVKSVAELRKGARICCYWSRQYKCLSTGVVTSRTFEATKSLVSVKYDNGDLSALPLEDLRLLPPDYPKYMSNCDPLLLARNGDGTNVTPAAIQNNFKTNLDQNMVVIDCQPTELVSNSSNSVQHAAKTYSKIGERHLVSAGKSKASSENVGTTSTNGLSNDDDRNIGPAIDQCKFSSIETRSELEDNDTQIPTTNQTIEFITSDEITKREQENFPDEMGTGMFSPQSEMSSRLSSQDHMSLVIDNHLDDNVTRLPTEANNFGVDYPPWVFDGPQRRTKRHGRTYHHYSMIRRGNEVIRVGDSAELMPMNRTELPFVAKIDGLWAVRKGEMRVRVRWYYRLEETKGEPSRLKDGDNALFETEHFDENDVQSIYRSTKILTWSEYNRIKHQNEFKDTVGEPKIYYLAGQYDPVRKTKYLEADVKEGLQID